MSRRPRLPPIQLAWLAGMGADISWLAPLGDTAAGTGLRDASHASLRLPGTAARDRAPAAARKTRPDRAPAVAIRPEKLTDLSGLASAVQDCRSCARHTGRSRAVPGSGNDHPFYMLVGEQPGLDDDAAGKPFHGEQGRLLQAMLACVDLPHADSVWATHTVKCRAAGGQEPDAGEIAACLPWLHQEISLLQPRWIMAFGRVAARSLLGSSDDFDVLRGGPHEYVGPDGARIPVWVTHQPAALLVRGGLKAEAWRDLVAMAAAVRASLEAS